MVLLAEGRAHAEKSVRELGTTKDKVSLAWMLQSGVKEPRWGGR